MQAFNEFDIVSLVWNIVHAMSRKYSICSHRCIGDWIDSTRCKRSRSTHHDRPQGCRLHLEDYQYLILRIYDWASVEVNHYPYVRSGDCKSWIMGYAISLRKGRGLQTWSGMKYRRLAYIFLFIFHGLPHPPWRAPHVICFNISNCLRFGASLLGIASSEATPIQIPPRTVS